MTPFLCTVKYACSPPREFMGKMKANVAFVASDQRVMDRYTAKTGKDFFRVNATAETPRHKALQALKRDQEVYLVKEGEHEGKPYFGVLDTWKPVPPPDTNSHEKPAISDVQHSDVQHSDARHIAELYWQVAIEISLVFRDLPNEKQEALKSWGPSPSEIQKLTACVFISQEKKT